MSSFRGIYEEFRKRKSSEADVLGMRLAEEKVKGETGTEKRAATIFNVSGIDRVGLTIRSAKIDVWRGHFLVRGFRQHFRVRGEFSSDYTLPSKNETYQCGNYVIGISIFAESGGEGDLGIFGKYIASKIFAGRLSPGKATWVAFRKSKGPKRLAINKK